MPAALHTSLASDAYDRLKADILSNALPAGFQAPEPEIAATMGMSRTPVREALIRLEAEGLVELVPRRGARVLPVLPQDMREIYELLTALEPQAAAMVAARKPTREELADVVAAMEAMEAALDADDLDVWARADDTFHRALLGHHENARLAEFVGSLFDQAHRARMITLRLRDKPVRSTKEHRDILDALFAGDETRVRTLFAAHRELACGELLNILNCLGLKTL